MSVSLVFFFFPSRRRHTIFDCDWSSDVCSSDLDEHSAVRNRGCRPHANGLTCQTAFTKEVTRSQNGDDRLFADFIDDAELHTAFLYVHYALSGITLGVDELRLLKLFNFSRHAR